MKSITQNTLSKSTYLNTPAVEAFVHYVASLINGAPFKHVLVVRDPKLPANDARITNPTFLIDSLEGAFNGYWWDKQGYEANAQKLRQVQVIIRNSIKTEHETNAATEAIHALSEVLEWGAGGTGQKLYTANMLWAKERHDTLIDSLRMGRSQMISETPNINIFKPSKTFTYARMNAGFTKYYALACDNVVIYDGRVGAALGLLVKTFCKANQMHNLPNELVFRWGAQNGTNPLNRDPSDDAYKFPKLPAEGESWAEWNIKANWILSAAQNMAHAEWCKNSDGLRRLEAALFVIGYSMPSEEDLQSPPKNKIFAYDTRIVSELETQKTTTNRFSDRLKQKLGTQEIHSVPQQRKGPFTARATSEGVEVNCLGASPLLKWHVFDAVEDLLKNSSTKSAVRGSAMNSEKLGTDELPIDSVEAQIAICYGVRTGEPVRLRRISPVANLLVWAGLCKHAKGALVML
jgi:hypothetical protein